MSDITPLKSFQPWKIYCVESSLDYVRKRDSRQVALTISLSYATIKEWYYLVNNQQLEEQYHEQYGQGI